MRSSVFLWTLAVLMLLLDLYVFQVFKLVAPNAAKLRWAFLGTYWTISVSIVAFLLFFPYLNYENWPKSARTYVFAMIVGFFISKLLIALFMGVDDVRRAVLWIYFKLFQRNNPVAVSDSPGMSRSMFLSWMGITVGGSIFSSLLYGFNNKYRYQVNRIKIKFESLPAAFKGLRIIHISDIHSGSFTDKAAVQKGIDKILKEKPDLVLFTGDLVNDRATEMDEYKDVFAKITAPMGVYSTLGNHDYGDYVRWESKEAKHTNLESLKQVHADMGWKLLMNEHVVFERDGEKIALLGIENWGAKGRFPKYGKMKEAHHGTQEIPFKILLSHDPSHWEAEVIPHYPKVDLMLAGHTHGMQFGVELPGFKWSPVQWMYRQWAGLYEMGSQKLYVNRGFGFLGYPGRVGILPEITLLELS